MHKHFLYIFNGFAWFTEKYLLCYTIFDAERPFGPEIAKRTKG